MNDVAMAPKPMRRKAMAQNARVDRPARMMDISWDEASGFAEHTLYSNFISPHISLCSRFYRYAHFTLEETKAPQWRTLVRSHGWGITGLRLKVSSVTSESTI